MPDDVKVFIGDVITIDILKTSNNQLCSVNKADFRITSVEEKIEFNCLTNSSHYFMSKVENAYLQEGSIDISGYKIINEDDITIRNNPTFTLETDNKNIAEIKEFGFRKQNRIQPNAVGEVVIKATPDSNFYNVNNEANYTIKILDKDKTNRVELCQINCVEAHSKYQALVAKRDVFVRLYNVNGNVTYKILDESNKVTHQNNITCKDNTKKDISYSLNDTCNFEIPKDFVTPHMKIVIEKDRNIESTLTPRVFPEKNLTITLVKTKIYSEKDKTSYTASYNMEPDKLTDEEAFARIKVFLFDNIPVSNLEVKVHDRILDFSAPSLEQSISANILQTVQSLQSNELGSGPFYQNIYYGLIPMKGPQALGRGFLGTAVGVDASTGNNLPPDDLAQCIDKECLTSFKGTMLHELGHTIGLAHAPCGNPVNTDSGWEYTYWERGPLKGTLSDNPLWKL